MKSYHSLLTRDGAGEPWAIAFGDYDHDVVKDERADYLDHDYKARDLKIITTGDQQADIEAAVRELNGEDEQPRQKGRGGWVICFTCRGDGHVVNPSIDGCGLSAEDFHEDPDFAEDYMSGAYDIVCRTCGGSGKLKASGVKAKRAELDQHAADRRLAAMEDGNFEAYCHAGDSRYG